MATVVPTRQARSPLAGLGDLARRLQEKKKESAAIEALNEFSQARGLTGSGQQLPGKGSTGMMEMLETLLSQAQETSERKATETGKDTRLKDQIDADMDLMERRQDRRDTQQGNKITADQSAAKAAVTARKNAAAAKVTADKQAAATQVGANKDAAVKRAEVEEQAAIARVTANKNTATALVKAKEQASVTLAAAKKKAAATKASAAFVDREDKQTHERELVGLKADVTAPSDQELAIQSTARQFGLDPNNELQLDAARELDGSQKRLDKRAIQEFAANNPALGEMFSFLPGEEATLFHDLFRSYSQNLVVTAAKANERLTINDAMLMASHGLATGRVFPPGIRDGASMLEYLVTKANWNPGVAQAYLQYLQAEQEKQAAEDKKLADAAVTQGTGEGGFISPMVETVLEWNPFNRGRQ